MTRLLSLLLLSLVWATPAHAQSTGSVNPTPGSVWTYLGPTYGADWVMSPLAGGVVVKSVVGYYYSGMQATASVGSAGTPSTDASAVFAIEKNFSTPASQGPSPEGVWQHPTLYSVCKLNAVGTDNENKSCRGIMAEGIDNVGGFGTFVEGGKFVGIGSDAVPSGTGGAYGVIAWGQSANSQYTIGIEGQTVRTGGVDAPGPRFFDPMFR